MRLYKFVTLILFFTISLNAQFVIVKNYGVKAAYITANQKWEGEVMDCKSRNGFMVGVYSEFLDFYGLSILLQAEYSQKGFQTYVTFQDYPNLGETSTILSDARLDYFSIPLMLKFSPNIEFDVVPYVFGGVSVNFLVNHISTLDWYKQIYNELESTVYAGLAGVGLILGPKDNVSLLTEFRYNFDLNDSDSAPIRTIKNYSYEFVLGVTFNSIITL